MVEKARKEKVTWGEEQNEALAGLIQTLTSPPILAMSDWNTPFQLHTDTSELRARAAYTQVTDNSEHVVDFASHKCSRAYAKGSPTEREGIAVLWAITHFKPYLCERGFTSIADFNALIWVFKSQYLSAKLH